ncbi:hypothetical protein L6164_018909 [Bauhinia variegata]|uniref:Uncharacterized protein n=1 Tax=Bauhinia variegata TaxID=167791 RepID=A0ACB9NHM4_BAUVA|nr:hypothetical protein L6164_018909 [Bauhinia variegata]
MADSGAGSSSRSRSRRWCDDAYCCVRGVFWVILVCFVSLMVIVGIGWYVMKPHEPVFQVGSVSVSNFTASDSELEGKYDVGLTIKNPNVKVKVWLDRFKVWVCYGETRVAEGSVEAMYLEKMSEKEVVSAVSKELDVNGKVSGDMGKEWRKEVVNLNVTIQVRAKYEYGIWPSSERFFDVYCSDLDVFFSAKSNHATGKLLGIGRDCRVQLGFSH